MQHCIVVSVKTAILNVKEDTGVCLRELPVDLILQRQQGCEGWSRACC